MYHADYSNDWWRMIKVFYMLANMVGILPETSSTYQIYIGWGMLLSISFPFLGATAAKKFGANQGVGMLLGALLIYPSFIAMALEKELLCQFLDYRFMLPLFNYRYSIILTVYILSKVEKLINRYCPDILKSFLLSLPGSLLVMFTNYVSSNGTVGILYIGTYVAEAVIWI